MFNNINIAVIDRVSQSVHVMNTLYNLSNCIQCDEYLIHLGKAPIVQKEQNKSELGRDAGSNPVRRTIIYLSKITRYD